MIPTPSDTLEIKKAERRGDWLIRIVAVVVVLTFVVAGASLLYRFSDAAKQSTAVRAVRVSAMAAKRADCRTAYNSDRSAVIEYANTVERQANLDFAGYLLGDPTSTTDKLIANRKSLDAANAAVLKLPTLSEMVDHGYTLNGVTHPACPKVT